MSLSGLDQALPLITISTGHAPWSRHLLPHVHAWDSLKLPTISQLPTFYHFVSCPSEIKFEKYYNLTSTVKLKRLSSVLGRDLQSISTFQILPHSESDVSPCTDLGLLHPPHQILGSSSSLLPKCIGFTSAKLFFLNPFGPSPLQKFHFFFLAQCIIPLTQFHIPALANYLWTPFPNFIQILLFKTPSTPLNICPQTLLNDLDSLDQANVLHFPS